MGQSLLYDTIEEKLKDICEVFDIKGDCKITFGELRRVAREFYPNITNQQLEKIMKKADKDGNGQVDYVQFAGLMREIA